ncbi:hypothetical protein Bca101_023494 [Brassica carinata]
MKSFFWNLRGLNGDERQDLVVDWIRRNRPLLGGFLETHVKQENLQGIMNSVVPGWRFEGNYSADADNGRIVVVWDPLLSVVIYYSSPQLVLCGVFNPQTVQSFTAAFVYARNRREERVELWNKIKEFSRARNFQHSPWILLGDYNQVLSADEVFSSTPYTLCQQGVQDFSDCIEESIIFDLAFRGCHHTWYNKSVTNPKSRKIDRALVNEAWLDSFPNSYAFFDSPGSSDHTPCIIYLANQLSPRKCRFIYYDMFSMHPDFKQALGDAWRAPIVPSSPMSSLYQRLRSAKGCCKTLNRNSFSNIQARAKEAKQALDQVQMRALTDPSTLFFQEESEARKSWIFYAAAEESFLHQKSRVRWLSVGDMNTGVFHKAVRANLSRNVIHYLLDSEGRKIFDSATLKSMTSQFYELLLGSENSSITPYSVDQLREIHPTMATVSQAISDGSWALPRGRHRIIQIVRASLPPDPPILSPSISDIFLWKNNPDLEPGQFKASRTWETLFPASPPVSWHKTIWFKIRIPKHAFLAWITILNSGSGLNPPLDFEAIIRWLPSFSTNAKVKTICNLLVQAIVYVLWKERNSRLHSSSRKPFLLLVKEVKKIIKAKLFGLDRATTALPLTTQTPHHSITMTETYLQLWFRYFDV